MSRLDSTRRFGAALVAAVALAACGSSESTAPAAAIPLEQQVFAASLGINLTDGSWTKLSSGVYYKDITAGVGPAIVSSSTISALYSLWLPNGSLVQSNDPVNGGTGGAFTQPLSGLIEGWKSGLLGMKAGGKRRLVVPASQGYGALAQPGIPANSNLVFDVTLQGVT